MNGIIKRQKTSQFAQIENHVLQNSLSDIRSIGLIAHLMSMPANWQIQKTHLYRKFGRGPITNAIAELEEKKYWVHITYRDGSKTIHSYHVSDVPFMDEEVSARITEITDNGLCIRDISAPFQHLLPETNFVVSIPNVDFGHSKTDSQTPTVQNQQLLNKEKEIKRQQIQKSKRNIVNLQEPNNPFLEEENFKQALTLASHEFYPLYAPERWSKQAWETLIATFVEETVKTGRNRDIPSEQISPYARAAILNMVHAFDRKNRRKTIHMMIPERPVPFYDWVSGTAAEEEQV
ncbi:hypothetical protein M3182_14740 [Mesobacillus maritimus]|uniref:hypothetical protein n=1 Tax=Mesobacillus maritimus TaxID=1643336 RepID=UPI00203AA4C6|nr:hypothetical protein [Mesobacillus maritimus]MCM3586993.1 hypothetical protein [Mesobacillus maritimus]